MPATVDGIHGYGNHASRPAATAVPVGAVYFCTDHGLMYRSDGATWSTWTPGSSVADILDLPTAELDDTLVLAPDGAGGVEFRAETGGGGGGTVAYGSLKPGTPTYDFDAALSGFTAVSNTGSFSTGNCYAQALDGSHLSLGYQAQSGFLYQAVSNVDMVVSAGGMYATLADGQSFMHGIAVLNSSNTGVGLVAYNDGNVYLASITSGAYTGILQTIAGYGHDGNNPRPTAMAPYAFRINRVGNGWTGQISMDGNNWLAATASSSVTITAARVAIGLFYDPTTAYKGRVFADWLDVT